LALKPTINYDLRVLRGVIRGFSEEARTHGFPSPPLGEFGFVVFVVMVLYALTETQYSRYT